MHRPLRVLAVTHNFPFEGDPNSGIWALRQLEEMQRQGADVTVLVPRLWIPKMFGVLKKYRYYALKGGVLKCNHVDARMVDVFRPPGKWFLPWDGMNLFRALKRRVLHWHRQKPFDVIYAIGLFPEGDACERLSRLLGIPWAGLAIGGDVNVVPHQHPRLNMRFVDLVTRANCMMACGHGLCEKIRDSSGVDSHPVFGVVDLARFCPVENKSAMRKDIGLPEQKTILLFAGHLIKAKGIYELLEAFERALGHHPELYLVLCGEGAERENVLRQIQERDLSRAVRMAGTVDSGIIHKWMQASDLFCLPSYHEGMPNAVMEAMACGLPVLVSAVGGLPHVLGDCRAAVLFPPRQTDALYQSIEKILSLKDEITSLSEQARQVAEASFGIERNASLVLTYLSRAVDTYHESL